MPALGAAEPVLEVDSTPPHPGQSPPNPHNNPHYIPCNINDYWRFTTSGGTQPMFTPDSFRLTFVSEWMHLNYLTRGRYQNEKI